MERAAVKYGPALEAEFEIEQIGTGAGYQLRGGSGASCWGYNQSNIVRWGEQVYALSWRDDLRLVVYRRRGPGQWEESPPLPPVPQNGNVLVDQQGRLHLISGADASWHALFEAPARNWKFELREYAEADSRFGAAINGQGQILVAGGLKQLAWYVLDPEGDYRALAAGRVQHEEQRGYNFTAFAGRAAHAFCSDDYFVGGEQFSRGSVSRKNPASGEPEVVQTERGIYPVLRTYYYYCPDVFAEPENWRMEVISDVSDTYEDGARGTTEQQDLLLDDAGSIHLIYFENRQPVRTVWASEGQDPGKSRLYHAVGEPGGALRHFCLGNFNSGRLYQGMDGNMHYLLTRGRRGAATELWYSVGVAGDWGCISRPVRLAMPTPFWHLYINTRRAGGTLAPFIDCYWTGPYQGKSNEVWYARLQVAG